MRIGIDVRSTQTISGGRGLGRYTFDLVASLVQYTPEHEYVLIRRAEEPLPEFFAGLGRGLETLTTTGPFWPEVKIPLYLKLPKLRSQMSLWQRFYRGVRRENQAALERVVAGARLDVLHFPTALDLNSFPVGRFVCPVVRTFPDATPLTMREYYYDIWPLEMKAHYDEQLAAMRDSAMVTTLSDSSTADAIRFSKLPPDRVRTVYCAIADDWSPVTDPVAVQACRTRHGIEGDYFVFCGPHDHNKNLLPLVRAFAAVRAARTGPLPMLVLITSDEDGNVVPILKEAWRLGLSRREVAITGRVTEEELRILFGGAIAEITPSLYEGFGLPAAQALCLGTPVLASDVTSLPEVVGKAGLYFDPRDEASIAAAMGRILDEPGLRDELSARAPAQGRSFSFERQAREMMAVYERAVETPLGA